MPLMIHIGHVYKWQMFLSLLYPKAATSILYYYLFIPYVFSRDLVWIVDAEIMTLSKIRNLCPPGLTF